MLQHRAEKEISAEQALAAARHEYNRRLNLLHNTRRLLEDSFNVVEADTDVLDAAHLSFYRSSLSRKVRAQERDVGEASRLVEDKRCAAVKARQDRQVIETLKDKYWQHYKREAAAREQKTVDELALYGHMRNKLR